MVFDGLPGDPVVWLSGGRGGGGGPWGGASPVRLGAEEPGSTGESAAQDAAASYSARLLRYCRRASSEDSRVAFASRLRSRSR